MSNITDLNEILFDRLKAINNDDLSDEQLEEAVRKIFDSVAAGSEEAPQGNNLNKTKLDLGKIWALAHGKVPWTLKEIAEEMGCSATTIYYHLSKMRKERGED